MYHKGFQEYGNIFSYFADRIKRNGVFSRANTVMKYARRYMFISRLIKYMSVIISFIETSATLIVLSSILIVSIPIFLLTTAALSLVSLYQSKECNKILEPLVGESEKIMFIYADKGFNNKKSDFLKGMAKDFSENGYLVFVISHSALKDGITAAKNIGDGLWLIRLNYFYIFKKKVLKDVDQDKLTYIS